MNPPIIFFQREFEPYLAVAVNQARRTNPDTAIFLLGDASNDLTCLGATHVPYGEYVGRRDEFVSVYRHFSLHELECERLCIERWFYLAAFVESRQMDRFFFMDSDVLLFANLAQLVPAWEGYEAAGVPSLFATGYFTRSSIVSGFCDFILSCYRDEGQVQRWRNAFEDFKRTRVRKHVPPVVNDMELSRLYVQDAGLRVLDLRQPLSGLVFDSNILDLDGFEHLHGRKQLFQDKPGGVVEARKSGQRVQMACVHFGGQPAKRLMPGLTGWSGPLVRSCLRRNARRNLKKLIQYWYFSRQFRKTVLPRSAAGGV